MSLSSPEQKISSPRIILPKLALGISLAMSGLIAGCEKKVEHVLSAERSSPTSAPPVLFTPDVPPISPVTVAVASQNIDQYELPPQYGKVIDRYFDPKNSKTIVYIADRHALNMNPIGLSVQRDIYYILEDILKRQGALSLLIEDLSTEVGMNNLLEQAMSVDLDGVLKRISSEKDPTRRQALARAALGKYDIPATLFALLAYPEIVPLGSVTLEDNLKTNAQIDAVMLVDQILKNPSMANCPDGENLGNVSGAFFDGSHDQKVLDCYCGMREKMNQVLNNFSHDRFVNSPRKEMDRAFAYLDAGHSFVVVVAGTNHMPEAMRMMRQRSVNRIVIAPNNLVSDFPQALDHVTQGFGEVHDRHDHACQAWERQVKAKK